MTDDDILEKAIDAFFQVLADEHKLKTGDLSPFALLHFWHEAELAAYYYIKENRNAE